MSTSRHWLHTVWIAPLSFVLGLPATAQMGTPTSEQDSGISEVIVTARKREETLLSVPMAVTAVSAEQIAREGIKDVEGIIGRDPSLSYDLGIAPYDTRIVIRGLSPTRGRPNVATLVDGIDVSSESIGVAGGSLLINPRLIDIAQIEVVKGPQSALYGRSAFAGAINYITEDPAKELSGSVSAEFNQYRYNELKASLSMPFTDTLGMRLNGYNFDDRGFYKNSLTGAYVGGGSGMGGSLSIKWQPNDLYSIKFRTEYSDDKFDEPAQANIPFNGRSQTPAAASSCRVYTIPNPAIPGRVFAVTGPILDPSCANLDANALVPGTFRNPINRLELATGSMGIFDDAHIRSVRGAVPDSRSLSVTYNPDFTQSQDNGLTGPEFPGSNRQVTRLSAVQALQVSFGSFSSLSGYTRALVSSDLDFDKTAETSIMQTLKTASTTEQFSQELRFTSDFKGPVQSIVGAQYWTERMDQWDRNGTVIGSGTVCVLVSAFIPGCPAPAFGGGFTSTNVAQFMPEAYAARVPTLVRRLVKHESAYFDLEWKVIDSLKVIGEGRFVDEDNTIVGPVTAAGQAPGAVILCGSTGSCNNTAAIPYAIPQLGIPASFMGPAILRYDSYQRNDSYFTPKVTLQWQPNNNLNIYGSFAKGEKPGGFATLSIGGFGLPARADVEFQPERINVYELGAKWASDTRRVQVIGALFKQDYVDKQVSSQIIINNQLGTRVTNVPGAVSEGMELSAQWKATDHLSLAAGLTHFFKYDYTDYTTLSAGAAEVARVGNCVPVILVNATNNGAVSTCQITRNGNKMEDVAENAMAFNASWRSPIGGNGWNFTANLDANYEGKRFIEDDNTVWLEPYWLAGARVGVENARASLQLFVDNIADNRKVRSAGSGPANAQDEFRTGIVTGGPPSLALRSVFAPQIPSSVFADLPSPRTVGVRLRYKF